MSNVFVVIVIDEDIGTEVFGPFSYEDGARFAANKREETGLQVNLNELKKPE